MTELVATAADGCRLAVTLHDGPWGAPTLLMIPGLGASRSVYDPLVDRLAGRLGIAVFDPRGVGASEVTPGPYSMPQLAGDAVAVLDALGLERGLVWGASMGGMVAQHLALDHGPRVARLLLGCTGPGRSHAVPADREATARLLGSGARTPEEAYRTACTVLYSERFQREHAEFIEAEIARRGEHPVPPRVFGWQRDAVFGHDVWERLPSLTAPTTVLHGELDAVMPVGNGRLLVERIPGAQGVWFEGLGHLFFHEDPDAAAAAVLAAAA